MTSRSRALAVVALVAIACSSTSAPQPTAKATVAPSPSPSGSRSPLEDARGVLAQTRLTRSAVPGPLYVSLVSTEVTPTAARDSTSEAGFELVVAGTESLTVNDAPTTVASGHAVAVPSGASRLRQAERAATSYFMNLRPASERGRSLPPGRSLLYDSADLPLSATPSGGYEEVLVMLVLAPGQVVPPHMHGGIEPTYVIEGTIELRVRGQAVRRLGSGQGDTILPDTPLLITNVGRTIARVLLMLATPDGKVAQSPADAP